MTCICETKTAPLRSTQVLVKCKFGGLNFFDNYLRQGLSRTVKPPCVLGLECSGTVVAVGEKVAVIKRGDHVIAYCPEGGALCQFLAVDQEKVLVLPKDVKYEDAACLTINYLTAYFTLCEIGGIKDGDSIFIQGAAGGVGWAATQIAKMYKNVTVFGTASRHKHKTMRENGVDYPLTYEQDINKEIRKICKEGVSIVLENMSGESFNKSQQYIKSMGKVILIGAKNMINGEKLSWNNLFWNWWSTKNISAFDLIMNNRCVAGFNLEELAKKDLQIFHKGWQYILDLYLEKSISPKIDSTYSMSEIRQACQRMMDRHNIGKILIKLFD